jgi:ankyrin repeat protein
VNCTEESCSSIDGDRNTPLISAAAKGHLGVVLVLLEGGADLERTNFLEQTALHYAAFYGHLDVCRLLLDWGAKVDRVDKGKYTPLHYGAGEGHLSVVQLLVERGADVGVRNGYRETAGEMARINLHRDVADWLDLVSRW